LARRNSQSSWLKKRRRISSRKKILVMTFCKISKAGDWPLASNSVFFMEPKSKFSAEISLYFLPSFLPLLPVPYYILEVWVLIQNP
jgi:hypothetical protein